MPCLPGMDGGRFAGSVAVWLATACSGLFAQRSEAAGLDDPVASGGRDVVVVGVSGGRAAAIAAHVASVRRDIEASLRGRGALQPWSPACTIHVHRDRHAFAKAVGGAPVVAGGATSIEFLGDAVSLRRIDVVDAEDGGMPGALAHELVHVVLADRFPSAPPPRWADEGLATLFDAPGKQQGHEADFRAAAAHGQAWSLTDLLALDLDPADTGRQRVFYGQSASLVRWLLARRDGPTFLRFLDDVATRGLEAALGEHYGLATITELERAWCNSPQPPIAAVAGTTGGPRSGTPRRPEPAAPAAPDPLQH